MEISPIIASKCFISEKIADFQGEQSLFGQVIAVLTNLKTLDERDFGHLAQTSRELYFR
jgi:hypothetical protein